MKRYTYGMEDEGPNLPRYMQNRPQAAYASSRGSSSQGASSRSGSNRSGSNGGSKRGGGNNRKRKVTRSQKLMRFALIALAAVAVVIAVIVLISSSGKKDAPPQTIAEYDKKGETFERGVSVAGVDVGGMTVSQAKPLVERAVSSKMGEVSISLQHGDESFTFTAADMQLQSNITDVLVEAMAYGGVERDGITKNSFDIILTPNGDAIINRLNSLASSMNTPAVEPHAVPELNVDPLEARFVPVEGQNGLTLNAQRTAEKIAASVMAGEYHDRLSPEFDELRPTMSLDDIMENTKKIASFSTKYSYSKSDETVQNRCFNIEKAAGILNLTVMQPGEMFSFNDLEGPRNAENGWKKANGIRGGKEFTLQYGGGICQVSTTLYGAVLRANLNIPDGGRRKHSIPSTYVPKGLDATVDTSGIDFKFENDTGAPLYIFAYTVAKDSRNYEMVVSLYGKPLPEGVEYRPVSEVTETIPPGEPKYTDDPTIPVGYQLEVVVAREGFVAEVFMEVYHSGELVSRNRLYSDRYGGNVAEYKLGTGDPLTTKAPEGATPAPGYSPPGAEHEELDPNVIEGGV